MKTKSRLLVFFMLFFNYLLFSQGGSVDPKVMMKTVTATPPDVTNLGRYMMQAPDHSNGLPQQNIPLHDIHENDISYPISLFYNYSGFRLTEDASSVGLGWGLSENVIIRIVKHKADEIGGLKQFKDFGTVINDEYGTGFTEGYEIDESWTSNSYNLTQNRLFYKLYDGQPDLYIYNCGGYSGKFLSIGDNILNLESNDVIIRRDGESFVITTPSGIRYSYQESEHGISGSAVYAPSCESGSVFTSGDGEVTTTWRLSEIKSNITNSKITIKYKPNSTTSNRIYNRSSVISFTAPKEADVIGGQYRINNYNKDENFNNYTGQMSIPDVIETDNTKIVFVTKSRSDGIQFALDRIEVYLKQNLVNPIKTITFNHQYFGNVSNPNTCWLKLKEVLINGAGNNSKYQLSYVDESFTSFVMSKEKMGIDHWGYFNGTDNQTLLPYSYGISAFLQQYSSNFNPSVQWAYREPDFVYAKKFALEKIHYPTGGYTKFNYESAQGKGLRVESLEDFDGKLANYKYYKYFPDQALPVYYDKTEYYMDGCCTKGPNPNPSILKGTFFSNSRSTLDYYDDDINQYNKVIEYLSTPDGQGGRTEYNYTWYNAYYTHKRFLEEKIDYAFSNPNFVRKEKYNYSPAILKTIDYWEVPKLYHTGMPSTCDYVQACCPRDPDANTNRYILGQFDGGFRSTTEIWYRLIGTETTEGGVQQVRSLEYKPINQVTNLPQHTNPIKTEETLSNGNIKQNYLYYSGDTDPDNPSIKLGLSEMWDITNPAFKNYITPVIKTRTFVNNTLIAKEAHHFSFDPVNSFILRTGYETLPRGVEAGKVTWSYGYDNRAKMVRIGKVGDVEKAYIWGYNHTYPVAEVIGESFAHVTAGLNLSIIDNVNGVYSEQQVRDELNKIRINFPNAHVTTYTYQPLLGMKSQTDVDGRTTYFEYDLYGRLKLIKNMDGKILKSYEYKYAQ